MYWKTLIKKLSKTSGPKTTHKQNKQNKNPANIMQIRTSAAGRPLGERHSPIPEGKPQIVLTEIMTYNDLK